MSNLTWLYQSLIIPFEINIMSLFKINIKSQEKISKKLQQKQEWNKYHTLIISETGWLSSSSDSLMFFFIMMSLPDSVSCIPQFGSYPPSFLHYSRRTEQSFCEASTRLQKSNTIVEIIKSLFDLSIISKWIKIGSVYSSMWLSFLNVFANVFFLNNLQYLSQFSIWASPM